MSHFEWPPKVVRESNGFRVVQLGQGVIPVDPRFALEASGGIDSMQVTRWVMQDATNNAGMKWLIEQVGRLSEALSESQMRATSAEDRVQALRLEVAELKMAK